jgi:hypothetical protein
MKRPFLFYIILIVSTVLMAQQSKTHQAATFTVPDEAEERVFQGMLSYVITSPDPPFETLELDVWNLRPSKADEYEEMDVFLREVVIRNMNLKGQPKLETCPLKRDGYKISCMRALGSQGASTYHFQLISIRKNGVSQWVVITRSNNPSLMQAEVDAFLASLTFDAARFTLKK